jgi:hypothetical protein
MTRTLALAALLFPLCLPAQQVTQQLQLPMASHTLGFHITDIGGFDIVGDARGVEGLDYSAGASVSTPHDLPVIHRVILDRSHHLYFGYDLTLTHGDNMAHVKLHFAPLSDLRGFHFDASAFQPGSMDVPEDRIVNPGDPTEVVLELDAKGGTMLRDTLTVTRP